MTKRNKVVAQEGYKKKKKKNQAKPHLGLAYK